MEDNKRNEEQVRSKAIVKFQSVTVPASFSRLELNTDLNLPPANWLSNASASSYGIKSSNTSVSGFSSFKMAQLFMDCVGEVDVISDSENIKNLLKLPYTQKGVISMLVHRVGNTLLIDEFDLHKYLLRKSDEDWKWLRSFIFENIQKSLSDKDRSVLNKHNTREMIQQNNLMSKFLYYSIEDSSNEGQKVEQELQKEQQKAPLQLTGPILPEAEESSLPEPESSEHARNVLWNFEDIRMLIGSDMQIFGNSSRPCISLRLRDMKKPINILTGIDYWLDNLMCNVPEIVMCFHLEGVVQKYELIKTEDLPYMENSNFSPKLIRNVAKNILSFLKSNATKAGHTYWLFKGKNDEVVKLYDLSTLCKNQTSEDSKEPEDKGCEEKEDLQSKNPFTIPVAMLLYSVARNLKNSTEKLSAKQAGSIKMLLDNCLKLLPKEKYPQIVTSSHYILSDLHIPAGIDPVSPKFYDDTDGTQSVFEESLSPMQQNSDTDDSDEPVANVGSLDKPAIQKIQDTLKEYKGDENWKYNKQPPPLTGTIDERCEIGLHHIIEGLDCLQFFDNEHEKDQKAKIQHEECDPKMANPNEAIPMPMGKAGTQTRDSKSPTSSFKKSKKKNKKKEIEPEPEDLKELKLSKSLLSLKDGVVKNWNIHLKILLFEKNCLIYATLAEYHYTNENYGRALMCLGIAIKSQELITQHVPLVTSQLNCLLGRAGDCYLQISKNLSGVAGYVSEFEETNENDKKIVIELEKDIQALNYHPLKLRPPVENLQVLLQTSCYCYELALKTEKGESRFEFLRRLGNVRNELGVKLMHWTQNEYNAYVLDNKNKTDEPEEQVDPSFDKQEPLYQTLAKKSFESLMKGAALFEEVDDSVNLAFLLCNLGRFFRLRAHIRLIGEEVTDMQIQKKFYKEAFKHYERALGVLESRKINPELWDLVKWELSTATFILAKQMQDASTSTDGCCLEELEQETIEMLQKSLKLCDLDVKNSKQELYNYRAGLIHRRLASFYHNSYRSATAETRERHILQLCLLHYEKSATLLGTLKEDKDFLEVQMERVAFNEFQADSSKLVPNKLKTYRAILDLFFESLPILAHLVDLQSFENMDVKALLTLLKLFEQRLQSTLKWLAKLSITLTGKSTENYASIYKKMFGLTLSKSSKDLDLKDMIEHLFNLVKDIQTSSKDFSSVN